MIERRIAWWAQSFRVANAMAAWRLAPRELASEVDVIKKWGNSPSASITRRHIYALREPYARTGVGPISW
jgi:hypothetical protein